MYPNITLIYGDYYNAYMWLLQNAIRLVSETEIYWEHCCCGLGLILDRSIKFLLRTHIWLIKETGPSWDGRTDRGHEYPGWFHCGNCYHVQAKVTGGMQWMFAMEFLVEVTSGSSIIGNRKMEVQSSHRSDSLSWVKNLRGPIL
ncbi:hypothetical protein H5410_011376 [Solanum commersonii]|uniref:Uncharacterized protein n=1 Tax=Solanum commersonii TaxID=4109 RepID=A0A9J6ANI2_SOLCO|nr:hypothetical protein H5410_011376 [Solanum commersonii]